MFHAPDSSQSIAVASARVSLGDILEMEQTIRFRTSCVSDPGAAGDVLRLVPELRVKKEGPGVRAIYGNEPS